MSNEHRCGVYISLFLVSLMGCKSRGSLWVVDVSKPFDE